MSLISGHRIINSISKTFRLRCDNSVVVLWIRTIKVVCKANILSSNIQPLAIRERVKEKNVVIEHVSTEVMLADPLTKVRPPKKHKDHVVTTGLSPTM